MRPPTRGSTLHAVTAAPGTQGPRALQDLAREYHHLVEEHRRAGVEGTARRQFDARLKRLGRRFERVLGEWVGSEELRSRWLAHLYDGAAAPATLEPDRPLVFRGRSEAGSVVEVRERGRDLYDVEVDGTLVERVGGGLDFAGNAPHVFRLGGSEFREEFAASSAAVGRLRDFVVGSLTAPPWADVLELAADGLIDASFGLTERGRRALQGS
jgi:hypothetical protein